MRKQLEDEIVNMLIPYIGQGDLEDVKMRLTLILQNYNVCQEERALAVYEENETQVIFRKFIASKIAAGLSPRTVKYYKDTVGKVLRAVGKPYEQVTADDIRYYLAMRVQRDGVTKVTADNERRCVSAFYGWLQKEEIVLKNPMNKVDAIKITKKKKKAFTQMEVEMIRRACRSLREEAIVEVLLSTWARATEVCEIRINEIRGNEVAVLGKGDKERTVFLTPRAMLTVERYIAERSDDNPYLFPRAAYAGDVKAFTKGQKRRGSCEWYKDKKSVDPNRPMDRGSLEGIIRTIGRRAGVENTHPHRFRRTGATMALNQGMPLIKVSKILGHEQLSTTQIYLDVSDEDLMRAHEKYVT